MILELTIILRWLIYYKTIINQSTLTDEKEKMVKSRPASYYRNIRDDIYAKFNYNNNEFIKIPIFEILKYF